MTLKKKINWKHLLLHLIAIWSLQQLGVHVAFLSDISYLENLKNLNSNGIPHGELVDQHFRMMLTVGYLTGGGLLLGFILSLGLSIYRKWFWFNSLLAFLLLIGISIFLGITEFNPFKSFFNPTNGLFNSVIVQELFFVSIFLLLSLTLFFLPPLNRWIAKDYQQDFEEPGFQFEEHSAVRSY